MNASSRQAMSYANNSFSHSFNGATPDTDDLGSVPTVHRLSIGNGAGIGQLNGHIRSIRYYPKRLSDESLVELTTP